jgi:hypothetical protein
MTEPLQDAAMYPMGFGQILERIFHLLRQHFRLFLSVAAVPAAAFFVFYAVVGGALFLVGVFPPHPGAPDPMTMFSVMFPAMLIGGICLSAVFALGLAAGNRAALEVDAGQPSTFRGVYSSVWRQPRRYVGLLMWIYFRSFLPALAIFLLMFGCVGLMGLLRVKAPPFLFLLLPLGMLLYVAAYIYGIVTALKLSLAFPACIGEGLTARQALWRSSQLTRGAKGRIFLVLLVGYAVCYVVMMVLFLLVGVVVVVFALAWSSFHLPSGLSYLGFGIAGVLGFGFMFMTIAMSWAGFATTLAVLYNDQRVRKDFPAAPQTTPGDTL